MSYNPQNPNGQATSANSAPVVIASDQSAVPVSSTTIATSANQTNASQKTQIVDSSGNVIGSTSNALNVNVASGSSTIGSVKLTDGTNTANVLAPGTANSNGNALLTASNSYSVTFSFTSATNGTAYDVGNYRWVSVQVNTQYTSSTINFQGSNDNSTWISITLTSAGTTAGTSTASTTGSSVIYAGALNFRYFRVTASGTYSSGTAAGVIVFSSATGFPSGIGVSTFGTGALTTGNITSSSGSVVSSTVTGDGGYAIIAVTGTYAGVSFGITQSESGGTTFYPVAVYDDIAGIWLSPSSTITPGTNATRTYRVPIYPYSSQIKLLASAYTSGTMAVRISMASSSTLSPSTMAQLMDAAGNNRGANVDASNNLMVNVDAASISGNLPTAISPQTSGGLPTIGTGSIGATATSVKSSAGQVYGWYFYNNNSAVSYVQFFNLGTGSVTLGTTAPTFSLGIPAYSAANVMGTIGIPFSTAITIAATTTRAGSTAPTNTVDYNIFGD